MALFNFKPKKKKLVLKKNMSWPQAKAKYPKLSPFGDTDRDGVKNWLDCKPFDRRRQDEKKKKFVNLGKPLEVGEFTETDFPGGWSEAENLKKRLREDEDFREQFTEKERKQIEDI